jgi:hypothetical protein
VAVEDFTEPLKFSAATAHWQTAREVKPEDMNSLTHRLRYQAEKLGLLITIHSDPERGTVSFLTSKGGGSSLP